MGKFIHILRKLRHFKTNLVLNVLFNLLSAVFSLFSFATVVPFLKILFNTPDAKPVGTATEPVFSANRLLSEFDAFLIQFIKENGSAKALLFFCIFIASMFLFKNATRYLALVNLAPMKVGVLKLLRDEIYEKLVTLPLSFYAEKKKGDLISRMSNDLTSIEEALVGTIGFVFRDPFAIILYLGSLLFLSWKLTLFVLVLLPVSAVIISFIGKSLRNVTLSGHKKLGEVIAIIDETISGLRIIKGFNAENTVTQKFKTQNQIHFKLMVRLFRKQYLASPLTEFMGAVVIVIIIWFGSQLVLNGSELNGEYLIAFIVIFSQLIPPAKAFSEAYFKIQKGVASAERIEEILGADAALERAKKPKEIRFFNDQIEFKNVCFAYEEEEVLSNINLTIKKGQTIALVGPSGAGKSTLVDLLPRFYDTTKGQLLIDNCPIETYKLDQLRELIGIVPQQSVLFNDTILENISLGNSQEPNEQIIEAAKNANAHDFITALENGYYTNIGERGSKLSGGQQQRIGIARALYKNAPILILDEATSSLDNESDKIVSVAIHELMKNRTCLVIAHRLSTIQHADLIVVISDGKIVESGDHATLLANNGQYKHLHDLHYFT